MSKNNKKSKIQVADEQSHMPIAELESTSEKQNALENRGQNLYAENERLSLAMEAAQAGTWEWDLRTNKNTWSKELWKVYGLEPYSCEPSYDTWQETIHPDDRLQAAQAVQTAAHTATELRAEWRVVDRDGSIRWLMSRGKPILNAGGEVERFLGVVIDITERKQLETNLHDSERRTTLLFQKSTVPVVLLKLPEVIIADVNEAAEKLTGFTREEMLGRTAAELGIISQKQRTEEIAHFEKEHALAENERRIFTKSGRERIVVSNTNPLVIGGQSYAITSLQDITERKQAEEALERTRNTLAEAQKIAHLGSFEYIAATQTTTWSEEEYRIYGLDPSEPSPAYEAMLQKCIHPDDAALLHETFTRAMQTLTAYELEHRVVRPDGSVRWVYDHARPYFDGQGNLVRYLGTTLDITERKQTEQALHASEAHYRLIADYAADVIWVLDPMAGKFTYVSPSVEKLRGYTPEEVMSQPVEAALTPESLKRVSESLAENLPPFIARGSGTEIFITEVDQPCKDGSIVNTEVTTTYVFNNQGHVEIVGVSRDITGRKRAEHALQESEHRYRELVQNANSAILRWRSDGTIAFFNEYAQSFFGYSAEEVLGKHVNIIVPQTESSGDDLSGLVKEIVAHPGQFINNVNENICKDGRRVWMIWSNRPVYNENGGLEEILAVGSDITERKRMEEELRRSNAELEQFAYIASHDLQEPLRAMAGMVRLLQKRYQGQLDARADEYIGYAVEASARMHNLIQDLLEYSRVERRGQAIEAVSAQTCLQSALKNLATAIQESQAVVMSDDLPTVCADPTQLTQLFQNLIGNGIKFHREEYPRISVTATQMNGSWRFAVCDNGIGIEAQYFERIFLVFQRLHTRREYQGTGIGLALCKKIVEHHGGCIWVESHPGEGSTFYFTLPIKE